MIAVFDRCSLEDTVKKMLEVIKPAAHAEWRSDKMGKATIYDSPRLLVGLSGFEPGTPACSRRSRAGAMTARVPVRVNECHSGVNDRDAEYRCARQVAHIVNVHTVAAWIFGDRDLGC